MNTDERPDVEFLPHVEKAFWAVSLRVGSLIIAILEFFLPFLFVGYQSWEYIFGHRHDQYGIAYYPAKWAYFAWIILHVVFIISAVLVIVAFAAKSQKDFLFVAVIVQLLLFIIYAVMAGVGYILLLLEEWYWQATFYIVTRVLLLAIFGYFVIVLNSWLGVYGK
nr:uncharacterized protein LOC106687917 isoform X2 [Halyomorpha halys]